MQDESEDEDEDPAPVHSPAVPQVGSEPGADPSPHSAISQPQVEAALSGQHAVPASQGTTPPQLDSFQTQLLDEAAVALPEEAADSSVDALSLNSEQSQGKEYSEGNGDGAKFSSQLEHPLSLI